VLTYIPPSDPPVLPSEDDPQGAKIGTGFAPSMEEAAPHVENLPSCVYNNDLDLRDNIYLAVRNNSETAHLTNVKVQVNNRIVYLLGTVFSQDDIGRVDEIVNQLEGIRAIRNNLQIEE
jgi:osmotically-inducible protein OsmY